jgi:uncharacterized protein (DUF1697 family)
MPTFVALLRGINVGKSKRIPTQALRVLLCGLGYFNVAMLLNSGNAVFRVAKGTAAKHAAYLHCVKGIRGKIRDYEKLGNGAQVAG